MEWGWVGVGKAVGTLCIIYGRKLKILKAIQYQILIKAKYQEIWSTHLGLQLRLPVKQ